MDIKEAKSYIQAGFAFAGWSDEQKVAFQVAWACMTKVQQKELKNDGLIDVLNQHHQVSLFSKGEDWYLQLYDKLADTNKENLDCLYAATHENLETLLLSAIEWVNRNRELF